MIQEYFYEIIISIILLTSAVIYFLSVKFKRQEEEYIESMNHNSLKQHKQLQELEREPPEIEKVEQIDIEKTEPFILNDSVEGSFGDISSNPFSEEDKQEHRTKIDVPPHGKIYKDNFKTFAGVKLLVVDDNIINQKIIAALLSQSAIEITTADDGQTALDILEKNSDFDMILMDVNMPKMNGFEVTKMIRSNPDYNHIAVVALSSDTTKGNIEKMIDSGMDEKLKKPLKPDDFYDILYAYTKSSKDNNEFIEVHMSNELNTNKGLSICGGDKEFYKEILNEFIRNYTNSSQELHNMLKKGDVMNADAMLLDLLGIAYNIGADKIAVSIEELKEAIIDTEEFSYITLIDEYEKHLNTLIKEIQEYI